MLDLTYDLFVDPPHRAIDNLAIDTALLYDVAEGRREAVFRMWDWSERAVILGSYQSVSAEFDPDVAAAQDFTFARRMSGGGAMVVEPFSTITWSIVVPERVVEGRSFVESFAMLDAWCVRALCQLGVPAFYRPINDIATAEGKLSGAAQCRRRHAVLHHVTMAYTLDNDLMFRLLRLDAPRTNPRAVASAVKRVAPLSRYLSMTREEVMHRFVVAFSGEFRCVKGTRDAEDLARVKEWKDGKFADRAWLYRVP